MVNKMNHIPTLSSTRKYPELHQPMLGIKIKLYSLKYFIQNSPGVKNNLHPLFLQERLAKDGLLPFKFPKLSCIDTEPNSWLPTSSRSCFPASTSRGFCLIRHSILIGCFNKTFCSVKHTVLRRKLWQVSKLFLYSHFATKKRAIFENKFFIMFFIMFLKQTAVKILIYTVKTKLCYSFF